MSFLEKLGFGGGPSESPENEGGSSPIEKATPKTSTEEAPVEDVTTEEAPAEEAPAEEAEKVE